MDLTIMTYILIVTIKQQLNIVRSSMQMYRFMFLQIMRHSNVMKLVEGGQNKEKFKLNAVYPTLFQLYVNRTPSAGFLFVHQASNIDTIQTESKSFYFLIKLLRYACVIWKLLIIHHLLSIFFLLKNSITSMVLQKRFCNTISSSEQECIVQKQICLCHFEKPID